MSRYSLSRFGKALARFLVCNGGVSAILFSLCLPILVGFTALGVEVASWYVFDRRLQNAADLSAIAGAVEIAYSSESSVGNQAIADNAVPGEIERNGVTVAGLKTMTVKVPPSTGPNTGDPYAVEVILAQEYDRGFSGVFLSDPVAILARAVATTVMDGNYCILALSKKASAAIEFAGSASANLGCGIASNSTNPSSIKSQGSAKANVSAARAAGGISNSGGLVSETNPRPYSNPVKDPYADLDAPQVTSCDYNNKKVNSKATQKFTPGASGVLFFCGGLDIGSQATVTLDPGIFVIADKDFSVGANATVKGTNVTIILTSKNGGSYAGLDINGTAQLYLSAPTTGPWAGILFYKDRDAPVSTSKINGDSFPNLEGVIYMPNENVEMLGNAYVPSGCLQVIGLTVAFTGNFTTPTACNDPKYKEIGAVLVALVE